MRMETSRASSRCRESNPGRVEGCDGGFAESAGLPPPGSDPFPTPGDGAFRCLRAVLPQPRAVDELDRDPVAPQPDRADEADNLIAGEDGGKFLAVGGADLRKKPPLLAARHLGEEESCAGNGLQDGGGLPVPAGFDVQNVVAELVLGEAGRVAAKMFVQHAHGAVVGVPGVRAIVPHGEQLGRPAHGVIRVAIVQRVAARLPGAGVDMVAMLVAMACFELSMDPHCSTLHPMPPSVPPPINPPLLNPISNRREAA